MPIKNNGELTPVAQERILRRRHGREIRIEEFLRRAYKRARDPLWEAAMCAPEPSVMVFTKVKGRLGYTPSL